MKKHLLKALQITLYVLLFAGGVLTCFLTSLSEASRPSDEETVLKSSSGVWELYYGKLLVSEGVPASSSEPDAEMSLPRSWFNVKTRSGDSLPLDGCATYRTTISLSGGTKITFRKEASNVSLSVYVNGSKIASAGKVGRTLSECSLPHVYELDEVYQAQSTGEAEVMIEVGYNFVGGLSFSPEFTNVSYHDLDSSVSSSFTYIALVCYLVLFVVELVSYLRIYDSTIYTVNMAGSIFFMALFSPLFNNILLGFGCFLPPWIFSVLGFAFFALFLFSVLQFYQFTYLSQLKKKGKAIGAISIALAPILLVCLLPLRLEIIAFSAYLIVYVSIMVKITYFSHLKNKFDITGIFTKCVFYSIMGMELCFASSSLRGFSSSPIVPALVYLFLIIALFIAIYVAFIVRTYRHAMNELKTELQNKDLKLLVLRNQIKPHFVFNCLSAIKALYHEDEETGDKAVTMLADHLRYNVDAVTSNLIAFEKELDNVYNYVELKNLRTERKFNLIYDIDVQDFQVPVLSIQPFVENAIKYSKVNEKEDGRIEISTRQDDSYIYIEIDDNGMGFDPSLIKEDSQGIRNVKERYQMLLGAEVKVSSMLGFGTRIKITIPKEKEGQDESNRD